MSNFYTPWKRQKTCGFLTFLGGIEMWHWAKIGYVAAVFLSPSFWKGKKVQKFRHCKHIYWSILPNLFWTLLSLIMFFLQHIWMIAFVNIDQKHIWSNKACKVKGHEVFCDWICTILHNLIPHRLQTMWSYSKILLNKERWKGKFFIILLYSLLILLPKN